MTDLSELCAAVAAVLRDDPDLAALAPNWGADDARTHVFAGEPPLGAGSAGRAPYVVVGIAQAGQSPTHQGARRDATTTVTVALRLVAHRGLDELVDRVAHALSRESGRHLGDPDHVLALALERGSTEQLGLCQATTLRLRVRLLEEPGA